MKKRFVSIFATIALALFLTPLTAYAQPAEKAKQFEGQLVPFTKRLFRIGADYYEVRISPNGRFLGI